MESVTYGSFPRDDENDDDNEILNKKTISVADVPNVKKSFLSFYYSGEPVRDIQTRKELYVSQLMTLDDATRSKLLNEAIKEKHDIDEYKSKLELACKRITSLRDDEKSIKSVLQQKKNLLQTSKENYLRLNTQTIFQLSTVNERIKYEYGCLDAEIDLMRHRLRVAASERSKIMDLIMVKLCEKQRSLNRDEQTNASSASD